MDLFPPDLRQIAEVCRIAPYHSQLHSLFQRLVKYAVNIADRFGRELLLCQEAIIKPLYLRGVQRRQPDFTQHRLDVVITVSLIGVQRIGLHGILHIGLKPGVQPFSNGVLRRFQIGPIIQFRCDLRQLLPDFLLCLSIDRFLDLFAAGGVKAGRKPCLPPAICSFADRPGTLRAFSRFSHVSAPFRVPTDPVVWVL